MDTYQAAIHSYSFGSVMLGSFNDDRARETKCSQLAGIPPKAAYKPGG